ncbi:MAG: ATP-binding protein [Acidobacteriota bacterium]|jgi:serine/threonine-protein kinase RsbW
MSSGHQIEIAFQSKVEYLNLVHAVTDEMARLAGFDGDQSLNISLAVREAATNAVIHGNQGDESKLVRVRFGIDDGTLRICVHDQGGGFVPEAVADPRDPLNVARTSGRGIFLMRSFMDEVTFSADDGEGMNVCMAKKA